ncbi:J domain-containing protein [Candidatus Puniceispirillum sp.]|nr:J domain-containing protein [Candidatus Puniceispirillum sp.]
MRRATTPDFKINKHQKDLQPRECAAENCPAEGLYPAPKSRDALRDYIWFCLDHVRAYNKSWNYYDGLQGAALEAEIRRATTWERPSWKFATGQPSQNDFEDPLGLFDFEQRDDTKSERKLSPEERSAWKILNLAPVNDFAIVKQQYKRLVKENHPDKNGGDAQAEERLKDINLAYSLIRKNLADGGNPVTSST